ncbi:hypothetical protein [Mycolicibacterium smegmatis]|nr:hypothetical protein [Mycolicibacterium smegmatis]
MRIGVFGGLVTHTMMGLHPGLRQMFVLSFVASLSIARKGVINHHDQMF